MRKLKLAIAIIGLTVITGQIRLQVQAQTGGPYTVTWSSTNSGVASSGGAYTLNAMLSSQGTSTSSAGGYTLGGVWAGAPEKLPRARLPIVVK